MMNVHKIYQQFWYVSNKRLIAELVGGESINKTKGLAGDLGELQLSFGEGLSVRRCVFVTRFTRSLSFACFLFGRSSDYLSIYQMIFSIYSMKIRNFMIFLHFSQHIVWLKTKVGSGTNADIHIKLNFSMIVHVISPRRAVNRQPGPRSDNL